MAEGQYSGRRRPYLYISDSGEVFLLQKDETLGDLTGTALTRATTGNVGTATPVPKRFEPRGVFWQGELDGRVVRKFLVCNATGTLYVGNVPQAVTIDGVAGFTTGKRGEQLTFVTIPVDDTP